MADKNKDNWGVPDPGVVEILSGHTITEQLAIMMQHTHNHAKHLHNRINKGVRAPLIALSAQIQENADQTDDSLTNCIETIDGLRDEVTENTQTHEDLSESIERLQEQLEEATEKHADTLAALETLREEKKKTEQDNLVFKRQLREMRQQLEDLRRVVSSPGQRFPQFSRLPPELRQLVWHFAIPKRLHCEDKTCEGLSFGLSAPAIAHVCRESRHVALGLGQFWRMAPGQNPGWSWFTPDRDIFLIQEVTIGRRVVNSHDVIEEVAVEPPEEWLQFSSETDDSLTRHLLKFNWGAHNLLSRLHTINVMVMRPTLVDKRWNPSIVSELFRGDSVVVVDLEVKASVDRVLKVLERDTFPGRSVREYDPAVVKLLGENYVTCHSPAECELAFTKIFPLTTTWKRARQALLERYVFNKAAWTPLTREYAQLWDRNMNPNMEIPWVEQTVNSLRIRPVHIFALLDGRPHTEPLGCLRDSRDPDSP